MADLAPAITAIEQFVETMMRADGSPGVSLAITDRERTLFVGGFGLAEIISGAAVTDATRFQIGSIGKSFAADVLLALAADGAVDLDTPVSTVLPWWQPRSDFAPITLHHLLTHTAGISSGVDGSPDAVLEALTLAEVGTSTPPGERFHYANGGYKILGLVIEAITGKPSSEVIAERLLGPLGMTASTATITHAERPSLAVAYAGLYDDRPQHPNHPLVPATWLQTDTADGAIVSTAGDMAIYARMLLNRGAYPGGRIYPEDAFARKIAPKANADGFSYGYGTIIFARDGRSYIGHTGGMVGYVAGLACDLDAGLAAVAFVNGNGSPNLLVRYAVSVVRAAHEGLDYPAPPQIGPSTSADLAGAFYRDGDEATDPITVATAGDAVTLQLRGESIPLTPVDDDVFLAEHPAWDRFALEFERDDDDDLIAFTHGGAWFGAAGVTVLDLPEYPAEWDAFPGHYRSHNPWATNFRIVLRRGALRLIFPSAPDGFDDDQPLVAIPGTDRFRAGDDPGSPERVSFGTVIDGLARQCWLSGALYVRDFTP